MTCLLYEISRLLLRVVKVHSLKHVVYKRMHHNMYEYILDSAVQIYRGPVFQPPLNIDIVRSYRGGPDTVDRQRKCKSFA
jgi:hypothetical protein